MPKGNGKRIEKEIYKMANKIVMILDILIQAFIYITLGDMIFVGVPHIKCHRKLKNDSFLITRPNRYETQGGVECSAFASAYVYRHFGKQASGVELYKEMPCKSRKGYVYCRGIVRLARKYGFQSKFYMGNLNALKNTVAKGNPVIVMVRSRIKSRNLHYITIVGYDNEKFYAVDSAAGLRNANETHYNRVIPISEFKKLWNISMLKQPLYFNLFFEICPK